MAYENWTSSGLATFTFHVPFFPQALAKWYFYKYYSNPSEPQTRSEDAKAVVNKQLDFLQSQEYVKTTVTTLLEAVQEYKNSGSGRIHFHAQAFSLKLSTAHIQSKCDLPRG